MIFQMNFQITGYKFVRVDHPSDTKRGSTTYDKSSLSLKVIDASLLLLLFLYLKLAVQ